MQHHEEELQSRLAYGPSCQKIDQSMFKEYHCFELDKGAEAPEAREKNRESSWIMTIMKTK